LAALSQPEALAPQLRDHQLQMLDQRLGAGELGLRLDQRSRKCGGSTGSVPRQCRCPEGGVRNALCGIVTLTRGASATPSPVQAIAPPR
jgi:hypothetical protein